MNETTFAVLSGLVSADQEIDYAAVSYERTPQWISLIAAAAAVTDCTVKLQLDAVDQAQTFTLGAGQKKVRVAVSPTFAIAAGVVPTAVCVTAGGTVDLAVWIESSATSTGDDDNWVVLTAGMLQSRISSPEYAAFTASIIQGSQADPVPQILADIAQQVRAAVRSGRKTALGPAGTIPASLKNAALALSKYQVFSRVTALRQYCEAMRGEVKDATELLTQVATGKITPEDPSDPLTTESTNDVEWGSDTKIDL